MSYIDKDATLAAIAQKAKDELEDVNHYFLEGVQLAVDVVEGMPETDNLVKDSQGLAKELVNDCISRRQAVYVCLELIHERRKWLSDAGQKEISGIDVAMCAIQDLPSAQPQRVRGKWLPDNRPGGGFWVCSCCKFPSEAFAADKLYKYCPVCGCRMDEGD